MNALALTAANMQPRISKNGKRLWSKTQKQLIVAEATKAGASVSRVSRQYDINANQIFQWIKKAGLEGQQEGQRIVPVGVIAAAPTVPKLIEIELQNGTKVRIDDEVWMPVLQGVLQMLRSLA
jgi:transposase